MTKGPQASRFGLRELGVALTLGALAAVAMAPAWAANDTLSIGLFAPPPSVPDTIELGRSATSGLTCTATRDDDNPAAQEHDSHRWTIGCRGWPRDVAFGVLFLYPDRPATTLNAAIPARWHETLSTRATQCSPFKPGAAKGAAEAERATCKSAIGNTGYDLVVARDRHTLVIGEGLTEVGDLVETGIDRLLHPDTAPAVASASSNVAAATTTPPGAAALADAVEQSHRSPLWLTRNGAIANENWEFSEAERDFYALVRNAGSEGSAVKAKLNEALNLSDEHKFSEADRVFASVKAALPASGESEVTDLYWNYWALHQYNQRSFKAAIDAARQTLAKEHMVGGTSGLTSAGSAVRNGDVIEISEVQPNDASAVFMAAPFTPTERMQILYAQASYVVGASQQALADPGALASLQRAEDLLQSDARLANSQPWLHVLILAHMAELELARGAAGTDAAQRDLNRAVAYSLRQNVAGSPARAWLELKKAAIELKLKQSDRALRDYRLGFAELAQSRGTIGDSADAAEPYFDLLLSRAATDPGAIRDFFDAAQAIVSPATARTLAELAAKVGADTGPAAETQREWQDAVRDLEQHRAVMASRENAPHYDPAQRSQDEAELERRNVRAKQLQEQLRVQNPGYGNIVTISAELSDVKQSLGAGEVYVKTVLLAHRGYGIAITRDKAVLYPIALSRADAATRVKALRFPFDDPAQLDWFDVNASRELFVKLFGPVQADVIQARHLIYEPDPATINLPASVFVTDDASGRLYTTRLAALTKGDRTVDVYKDTAWLGRATDVTLSVSATSFLIARRLRPSGATHEFIGFGAPQFSAAYRAPSGGAATGGDCGARIRQGLLQLADTSQFAPEIRTIAARMGTTSTVVVGQDFTNANIESLSSRNALRDYRVVFFGTHAVLPGVDACLPEPALVTSTADDQASNGLLDAPRILALKLDADLVVLPACDTAGQGSEDALRTGLVGSGESLGGLARDFFYAGTRGIVVSQWPIEPDATVRIMDRLFSSGGGTSQGPLSMGDALRRAQLDMMRDKEFSHPYYWAAFSLVGDGMRPMPGR